MSGKTLNELVRAQILAEGPQISEGYHTQLQVEYARDRYIDEQLDSMTRAELLERISAALEYRL
jgi:uncharacterized protein YpiB (UPF0302 family)